MSCKCNEEAFQQIKWIYLLSALLLMFIDDILPTFHIILPSANRMVVSFKRSGPGDAFLSLTQWCWKRLQHSQWPRLGISLFYKWINDLFPDSLLVSLQVHIEIHWNVSVGIRTWTGKIRLHSWAPMWRKRTRYPALHRDHTGGCRLTCVTWLSCLCTGRRWPRRWARMCLIERWRLWTGRGRLAVDEAHRFSSIHTGTQPDIN